MNMRDVSQTKRGVARTAKPASMKTPNPPMAETAFPPDPPASQTQDESKSDGAVAPAGADSGSMHWIGGGTSPKWNMALLRRVLATYSMLRSEDGDHSIASAAAALAAFKPADEIEGMLAAQATAMHFASMECFRRGMHPEQNADMASKLRKDGANLARGMADMLDALDRKRGKGPQVVRVERVIVHEGGQAIVGNVRPVAKVGEG